MKGTSKSYVLMATLLLLAQSLSLFSFAGMAHEHFRSQAWEQDLLAGEGALEQYLTGSPDDHNHGRDAENLLLKALHEAEKLTPGHGNVKMVRPLEGLAKLYDHWGNRAESERMANWALQIRQTPGAHQKTFEALAANARRDPYCWSLEQFKQLGVLSPELQHPRLGGQPPGGQDAWEHGQLVVHKDASTTLEGDFNSDHKPEIAVLLDVGGHGEYGEGSSHYLLIATQNQKRWQRVLLQKLDNALVDLDEDRRYSSSPDHRLYNGELIKHKASGLLFDSKRQIIGILTGEKMRLTKPASITTRFLPNGPIGAHQVHQQFGYVIDKELILPFRWDKGSGTYQQDKPCWYIDPGSEDALRSSGVDPESERVLRQ